MKYKLICIWNPSKDKNAKYPTLSIEVTLSLGRSNISPFQRRLTIFDLRDDSDEKYETILRILGGTGQITQPFLFNEKQLEYPELQAALKRIPHHFVRKGTSIKPVKDYTCYLPTILPTAQVYSSILINSELTISHLATWWKNIKISFRYENMINEFPGTIETSIPFIDADNRLCTRDYNMERQLLNSVFGEIDYNSSTLSLIGPDTTALKQMIDLGWTVYVPHTHAHRAKLNVVPNRYGINWFSTNSTDADISDNIADTLLKNYLYNRNFYESTDGNIALFSNKQLENIPNEAISAVLTPTMNTLQLYTPIKRLNSRERQLIIEKINKYVDATLMEFQIEGVLWLTEMRRHNSGCLLADEMGLGKTLQTLAYLSTRPQNSSFLVISPAAVIENWEKEISRFTPSLYNHITIVSFDQLRLNIDQYKGVIYDTLVIDEGQMVKNSNTQRYTSVSYIQRNHTIMLSGTPIENGIHEIWAQFNLLIPGIQFLQKRLYSLTASSQTPEFLELTRKLLSPFILRRTKKEIFTNFPDKIINNVYVELSSSERVTYDRLKKTILRAIETGITGRVNALALTGLLRLRQLCVCQSILPSSLRYSKENASAKFSMATSLIANFISDGHKIIVFSQFSSALQRFRELLDKLNIPSYILDGASSNRVKLIDDFTKDAYVKVILISLKAGGTGLNITTADRIILLDDWWNPAVEEQAFGRAHRIGQTKDIKIYRLICKDTIEEKILELQQKKQSVSDVFNLRTAKLEIEEIKRLLE